MNRAEAAKLLTYIATRDQRTIGDADVMAWQADLSDIRHDDAMAAVDIHFRTTRDRIMPFDIRDGVRKIRDKRLEGVDRIQPPDGLTPLAYRDWLRDTRAAVADGTLAVPAEITGQPIQLKALGGAA